MPFSQWNTLEVPLKNGLQCTLVPASQYRHAVWSARGSSIDPYPLRRPASGWPDDRDRWWGHSSGCNRQAWRDDREREWWERDERERQRDDDRSDFYRYFRPDDDLRTITGKRNLSTVCAFLTEILAFAHWNKPKTNENIRRVLCDLVRDGQLVPYMNREWRQRPRVFRPTPGPERWPSGGGHTGARRGTTEPVLTYAEFQALQRANGELPVLGISLACGPGTSGSLVAKAGGKVAAAEGPAFGSGPAAGDSTDRLAVLPTPLRDARPFNYPKELQGGEVELVAASTNKENYAAKMLGYNRKVFGKMIHAMKQENQLRGDDNVIWHDDGSVEFRLEIIDNMHSYAP